MWFCNFQRFADFPVQERSHENLHRIKNVFWQCSFGLPFSMPSDRTPDDSARQLKAGSNADARPSVSDLIGFLPSRCGNFFILQA